MRISSPFYQEKGSIHAPFATFTARAGVCFLPIPFAKNCKITLDDKAFYNIINYRGYPKNSIVESFSKDLYTKDTPQLKNTAELIESTAPLKGEWINSEENVIKPNDSLTIELPQGTHAVNSLTFRLNPKSGLQSLRSTIVRMTFDGKQTVWIPLGDLFCSPDTINPFKTRNLIVLKNGNMSCNWIMPYSSTAKLTLINLQEKEISISVSVNIGEYTWNDRSMYFHANWNNVGILPGNHFYDMNFIDITGKGVLAGDALTVLSPGVGWWGEGDEKIYIDEADVIRKFPSHFGTGTEDYYGWAGGVNPTGADQFSKPFGSNVRIGNQINPQGYNTCMRNRLLDNIPFNNRLVFDMEASPGTDIRNYWNLLSYSMVTWWYGMAGAKSNRTPQRQQAKQQMMSVPEIERLQQMVRDSILIFNHRRFEN